MIRVLHIGMTSNKGGLESFIMNVYRNIDRSKIQFDFLAMADEKIAYEEEIKQLGGNVYHVLYRRSNLKRYNLSVLKFLKSKNYKIVHHHRTHLGDLDYLWLSKFAGIDNRILHAHSTGYITSLNIIAKFSEKINRIFLNSVATKLLACGNQAGKWMFGDNKYEVVNNAININDFVFSNKLRTEIRSQYNIGQDKIVIGNVASFFPVKNQQFLIELLLKLDSNYMLCLIGDGPERKNIEKMVEENNLKNRVLFTGSISNVKDYYNIFDIFVLPSFFEGMPIVGVEAQTNGLQCIFSDKISKDIAITDSATFLSIESLDDWVRSINNSDGKRNLEIASIYEEGYDISSVTNQITNIYKSMS